MFAKNHQERQSCRLLGARSGQEAAVRSQGPPRAASESCGRCGRTGRHVPTCPHAGHSGELSQAFAFGLHPSTGAKCDKHPQRGVTKLSFTKSLQFGFVLWEDLPRRLADLPGTWSTPTNAFKRVGAEVCFHATLRGTGSPHCSSLGMSLVLQRGAQLLSAAWGCCAQTDPTAAHGRCPAPPSPPLLPFKPPRTTAAPSLVQVLNSMHSTDYFYKLIIASEHN